MDNHNLHQKMNSRLVTLIQNQNQIWKHQFHQTAQKLQLLKLTLCIHFAMADFESVFSSIYITLLGLPGLQLKALFLEQIYGRRNLIRVLLRSKQDPEVGPVRLGNMSETSFGRT